MEKLCYRKTHASKKLAKLNIKKRNMNICGKTIKKTKRIKKQNLRGWLHPMVGERGIQSGGFKGTDW